MYISYVTHRYIYMTYITDSRYSVNALAVYFIIQISSSFIRLVLYKTFFHSVIKENSITSISNVYVQPSSKLSDANSLCFLIIGIKPVFLGFLGFRSTWRQFTKHHFLLKVKAAVACNLPLSCQY